MWIIIEQGAIFEGSLEELNEAFDVDLETEEDVRIFCAEESWEVKVYAKESESWN